MSTNATPGYQNPGTTEDEPAIEGLIPEFDRFGDYTNYNYFRCTACGIEAMHCRDLRDGGYKCNGGWS